MVDYELYYWPEIPGRGEFVRLAFEDAGVPYVDMAREKGRGKGEQAMLRMLGSGDRLATPPFAPPFLKHGDLVIGQTANILLYLGGRLGLAPRDEAGGLWTHQLQLTIADFIVEIHDAHHPLSGALYYEDQKAEAARRAADFVDSRLPKFLGYFEGILARAHVTAGAGTRGQAGDRARQGIVGPFTHVDLSLFHVMAGLQYAFPSSMNRMAPSLPHLLTLEKAVRQRPNIAAYLASPRRLPFNQQGIFRHYPELDEGTRDGSPKSP
ncbi:MAG: glutathione S-transferase [Herminiimonas sp.]|nr:glutathione S-transferase [Herminiimonas sp.]MDB5855737.1 glutathione S-transferase [Herminiimonas sp.]